MANCENAKCSYCVNECKYKQLKLSSFHAPELKEDKLYAFRPSHKSRVYDTFAPPGVVFIGLTVSDYDAASSWEQWGWG